MGKCYTYPVRKRRIQSMKPLKIKAEPMWFSYSALFMIMFVYLLVVGAVFYIVHPDYTKWFVILAVVFLILSVGLFLWKGKAVAVFDEKGITLRGAGKKKVFLWEDIRFVGVCTAGNSRLRTGILFSTKDCGKKKHAYYQDSFRNSDQSLTIEVASHKSKLVKNLDMIKDRAVNATQDNLNYLYTLGNK